MRTSNDIWQKYSLDERYRFSPHSLLSSSLEIWQDAHTTLLRKHYRCNPKIINFCNQKFYHWQLFNQIDKHPVLAIKVDGIRFREAGSKQAERDRKRNSILEKCAVPLLRLRTDGSGEKDELEMR